MNGAKSWRLEELSKEQLLEKLRTLLEEGRALEATQESAEEQERILHDLRVHQVELEVQNRALREAQASLEESRSRYVELYDFAPVAYATLDPKGCILEINLTGATMLARDRAQLLGKPFLAVVKMQDPPLFWRHLRECAQTRSPVVSELSFSNASADARDVELVSTPVLDATGKATAFRTTFSDVTERKRAERELARVHALEVHLRARAEAMDRASLALGAALARLTSGGMREFLACVGDQAALLTGAELTAVALRDQDEAWIYRGAAADTVAALGAFPKVVGALGPALRAGQRLRLRDLRSHPSFAGFPPPHPPITTFLAVPICHRDEPVADLYVMNKQGDEAFNDDDESALAELAARVGLGLEIARLNQRLGEAVRARENLLAVVAHDLRSPLASIQLSAVMLSRGAPEGGERRKSKKHVDTILRTVGGMKAMIEDLLNASAIEAGHFVVDARPASPAAIVAEAVQQMAPLTAPSSLRLEQDLAPELPEALCDPPKIVQVLSNLIGNAIKFTGEDGEIRVRVTAVREEVRFAVSDTGCGIRAEELPHLFDRYWHGKTSPRHGMGLGLYIARGIVEAHGGRLSVETVEGRGSTFLFTLPTAPS